MNKLTLLLLGGVAAIVALVWWMNRKAAVANPGTVNSNLQVGDEWTAGIMRPSVTKSFNDRLSPWNAPISSPSVIFSDAVYATDKVYV